MNKGLRKASVASLQVESRNFEESKPRKPKVPQPPTCGESQPPPPEHESRTLQHAFRDQHCGSFSLGFRFVCISLIALLTLNETQGLLLIAMKPFEITVREPANSHL